MRKLLSVDKISVSYGTFSLHPLTFEMEEGEILSVIGESGSGKTTVARSISCTLDEDICVEGKVLLDGHSLLDMKETERKSLRMTLFSIVFQNSNAWLNPSLKLKGHLKEVLIRKYKGNEIKERMRELMLNVGLKEADLERYPMELSGGMVQRFMLANAIALSPKLVILDEPTSALDAESTKQFMALIKKLNKEQGIAFLLITHDLYVANELSDRMMVLYRGHLQEMGKTAELIRLPRHPYTRGLLRASSHMNLARDLWGIRPMERGNEEWHREQHGCPFYGRCTQSVSRCKYHAPKIENHKGRMLACNRGGIVSVLKGVNVCKSFGKQEVLNGVNLTIYSGEIASIIGCSGVGKTTLANILGGDLKADAGEVYFENQIADYRSLYRKIGGMQIVQQDSQSALNPNMTVEQAIGEPLLLMDVKKKEEIFEEVKSVMEDVELPTRSCFMGQKIHTLSGGEKQRVVIARALTMKPLMLIADEPTALLDVSSKANLLRMLKGLQNKRGLSMLIITHDLECAFKISDQIYKISEGCLSTINQKEYISINIDEVYRERGE